jgi:alpha-glucosidase
MTFLFSFPSIPGRSSRTRFNSIMRTFLCLLSFVLGIASIRAQQVVLSPDGKIKATVYTGKEGKVSYSISYNGSEVLKESKLGLIREDADLSMSLQPAGVTPVKKIKDRYYSVNAKKSTLVYAANRRVFHFLGDGGSVMMDIIFQVSNDGVAFRYQLLDKSTIAKSITEELTTFHFPGDTKGWLQPMSKARSGWEHSNPSYEEHYLQGISVNDSSPIGEGWVYPALFKTGNTWMLITETGLGRTSCGTRLKTGSTDELKIAYPDSLEAFPGGKWKPYSTMPWTSAWRIVAIGSLKTIAESTLGTDLAQPGARIDTSFVKPGKASWSWIMSKDNFIVYDEQKKYIDFASAMNWQYCLVDVDWDTKIGYEKITELAAYAKTKNVGLLLWYNSSGDWNTTKYHPKSALLTHEQRVKEFSRLQSMGIKGVKIDFFGGDGQSMMNYYMDILEDAAPYKLLINFHGATLPRGWQRTYPHLMTTEAIRGFEMITFGQGDADKEASHCTLLPFTRNAFDPMDFTPMNLYKIPTQSKRKTSSAFELALSVVFLSGIQHFAESPDGMSHVPGYVKTFLQQLPVHWDDTRFIDGFPGKEVIIARRSGATWYIAGINGENVEKNWEIDLGFLKKKKLDLITDGREELSFMQETQLLNPGKKLRIKVKAAGGFVVVVR